ncbi:MAG TPA: UvrB/UvrC motif-containing protein [Gemmatimonadales bacterium]|jgi:protein arginine kinase activator
MNPCQACHERDAVVRLTQIVGDEVTTLHLCSKCAAERGVETDAETASPLGAFLAAMDKGGAPLAAAAATGEECRRCHATLEDFRASGRLGCPECWLAFERPLREMLRRLHGATRHSGEQYIAAVNDQLSPDDRVIRDRSELREQLRLAIASEQFEQAAQLRDQLRVMEES